MSQIVYIGHPKHHHPQQTWHLTPTNLSLLCSKMATPVTKWLPKHTTATLLSEDFIPPSVTPSPGSMVGTQPSFHPKTEGPLFGKSPLGQLILPLNSRKSWIWMYVSRPSEMH